MTEAIEQREQPVEWPLRPVILALLLAVCALAIDLATRGVAETALERASGRQAIAAFFFFGGLATAFALERLRLVWNVAFGLVAGATLAGITYWVSGYGPNGFEWNWAFGSGLIALVIATPLFQTVRDAGRWSFDYDRLHFHAWTDVVIGGAALLFLGISWLLLFLLSGLFGLIGFEFLGDLIEQSWFAWMFSGASFGAALGILRENERILGTLQRVVLVVLSILAPPLALGLALFLVLLLFTGLDTLWDATKATTPILMACSAGAVILINAVIRNSPEETSGSRILQWSAMVLGATILPLAIIAAISMGLRIGQHGLSPERIWGLLVVAIATAYGLAYLVSLARGRLAWAEALRPANVKLAIGLCALALFLALPIADFGAWSTRDQLARLASGEVEPAEFDARALAFDFGPAGRAALEQLAKGQSAASALDEDGRKQVVELAGNALEAENRWDTPGPVEAKTVKQIETELRVLPEGAAIPDQLKAILASRSVCATGQCVLFVKSNDEAVFVDRSCDTCAPDTSWYVRQDPGGWRQQWRTAIDEEAQAFWQKPGNGGLDQGAEVEVREITKRQIFVDGKPFSQPFD